MHTSACWLKFGSLSPAMTLKNSHGYQNQIITLVEICQPVHEIWCTQGLFWLKFGSLNPAVTLKIRSRSPKPKQIFIISNCYIRANLVKIHPLVHEISYKQESVTPTPTPTLTPTPIGSAQKNNMSPSPNTAAPVYTYDNVGQQPNKCICVYTW